MPTSNIRILLYICLLCLASPFVWSEATVVGSSEREVLLGGSESNMLRGLEGDDILIGGAGNDVYLIESNEGHDIIIDSAGSNIIQFGSGITFNDVANGLMRSGLDITFRISNAQSVTVQDFFTTANTISELQFLAGSKITAQQVFGAFGVAAPSKVVPSHSVFTGTVNNDQIQGNNDHNIILAGPGDDYLRGAEGDNILVGGRGDDQYFIDSGTGVHLIIDTQGYNEVIFSEAIGFSDAANYLYKSGHDLIVKINNSDQHYVRVLNFFLFQETISEFYFESSGSSIHASQLFGLFGVPSPQDSVFIYDLLDPYNTSNQQDDDQDGVINFHDVCSNTPINEAVDEVGCSESQKDDDGDGVVNTIDYCPNTTDIGTVNAEGCSASQRDTDDDGYSDYDDHCPNTLSGLAVDENGCAENQIDTDGDGLTNDIDPDDDNDGVPDEDDAFPLDPTEQTDTDGDGIGDNQDTDADNDGYTNEEELTAGTDPLDALSNPWIVATVKSYLPKTGELIIHSDRDDGYYRNGSPRLYRQAPNVVYDEINGLIWEDTASTINNYQTWNQAESYCGSLELNGINNWRLPNEYELFYLLSHDVSDLTFFDSFVNKIFFNKKKRKLSVSESFDYWTSSSNDYGVLVVNFSNLSTLSQRQTNQKGLVRCVSGEERFRPNFSKVVGGFVTDKTNKLMWQDNIEITTNKHTWSQALNYCKNLEIDGVSGWRLPNLNETYTLLSELSSSYFPAFSYKHQQNGSADPSFWSSTSYYKSPTFMGEIGREIRPSDASDYARGAYAYPGSFKVVQLSKISQQYTRCVRNYAEPIVQSHPVPNYLAEREYLVIDTSGSISPENFDLNYQWKNITTGEEIGNTPSIQYPMLQLGINVIRLVLTDARGVYTQKDWSISVLERPKVHLDGSLKYKIGSESVLKALATSANGEIVSYLWKDAVTEEVLSLEPSLQLNYSDTGSHSILLEVVDELGITTVIEHEVFSAFPPVANFFVSSQLSEGEQFILDARSSHNAYDEPLQYKWFLNDTLLLQQQSEVVVDGLAAGTYEIKLVVTNQYEYSSEKTHTITVFPRPTVHIEGNLKYEVGSVSVLTATANSENGEIVSYRWLNAETDEILSETEHLTLSYTQAGTNRIRLEVTDSLGITTQQIVEVIAGTLPMVNIHVDDDIYEDLVGNDIVVTSSVELDRELFDYVWWLNGNIIGSEKSVVLSGLTDGQYTLELYVTDIAGFVGKDTRTVTFHKNRTLLACTLPTVVDDSSVLKEYPADDIPWAVERVADKEQVEKAFNYARSLDPSVSVYLHLPEDVIWNAYTAKEKGLYVLNAEREARGLKPFSGMDSAIEQVAQDYAEYVHSRNETIGHYNDGRTPQQRIDTASYSAINQIDNLSENESAAFISGDNTDDFLLIYSVYSWLYLDKSWFKGLDWTSGPEWGHRDHLLMSSLNENSGSPFDEGIVGFGIANGLYSPGTNPPNKYGGIAIFNTVDQRSSWDEARLIKVDTSAAHLCVDHRITLDPESMSENLDSIRIFPSKLVLLEGQTASIRVEGQLTDGTLQDLTTQVSFQADRYSIVSIAGGAVTAQKAGQTSLALSVGKFKATLDVQIYEPLEREVLLGALDESIQQYIPENAAHWYYDPSAMEPHTSYDFKAVAIYTGLVVDENYQPLANVTLSFLNNSRLGSVQTDNNGRFIIAGPAGVNQFNYAMSGRLPVQREGIGSSNSWGTLETVMLLPFDTEQSQIDLSTGAPQVHRASVVTDDRGTRQATVVFNGITQAKVVSRDGQERLLDSFLFSATEHQTPASMPGALPVETAYTYCAELHVDGVKYDDTVVFNGDVTFMVDNFLNFKVGEIVPVGSFNTITSQWDAERNGVIVMAIDSNGDGVIDGLDYTGDGIADDLNGNGSTTDEAVGLESYQHGDTLMWSRVSHFSAVDLNWSQEGDSAAEDAEFSANEEDKNNDEEVCTGSYVMPYQQSFHDDIPVAGTNVTLHYSSQRTADYQHKITVTLSGETYPERTNSMIAKVEVGGHVFERTFAPQANLSTEFIWDGKDVQGNYIEGVVRGRVSVGYEYQTNYLSSGNAVEDGLALNAYPIAWAAIGSKATAVEGREAFIAWNIQGLELKNSYPSQLAKGWSLSNVHELDGKQTIYLGSGSADTIKPSTNVLRTGITYSEVEGDDGYYQKGAIDEDYYISPLGTMVDRVTGLTWAYSNTPYRTAGFWDAIGYCSNLQLAGIQEWRLPTAKERGYSRNKSGIAANAIYQGATVWYQTVDNEGRALPVYCVSGEVMDDNYPKGMVRNSATEVVTDKNSGLMWQDTHSNNTATYYMQDAIQYCEASTHAGFDDWRLPNANELLYALPNKVFKYATQTPKDYVSGQYWTNKNFRLAYWSSTPSTRLDTKAWGVESDGFSSDFFEKNEDYYVRCVRDDNSILRSPYAFDTSGKHRKTLDINSGKLLTQLTYNNHNDLSTVEDAFGNRITVEYDSYGVPTRLVAPNGQHTELTIVDGKLISATYDDGTSYQFTYDGTLLTQKTDPNGHRYGREYDQYGRVTVTTDMEGGEWSFFDNASFRQQQYGYNTAEGLLYQTIRKVLEDGKIQKTTTSKEGAVVSRVISADELQESYQNNSGTVTHIVKQPDSKTLQPIAKTITVTQPSQLVSHTAITKTYGDDNTDFSRYELVVNHNGNTSTQNYNGITGVNTATSAAGRTFITKQNPANLLVQRHEPSGLEPTQYAYDNRGRLISETTGNRTATYSYNSAGQLASLTTPDHRTITYGYDALGRITQVNYPDGNSVQHYYDANGNHTSLRVPTAATHSFTYNAVNKVTGVLAPQTASTQYHYDRDRRLAGITLPSGQQITHHYQNGKLAEIRTPEGNTQYRYINGNQLIEVNEGSETLSYQYDGDLLTHVSYSGALNSQIQYGYNNDFAINQLSYAGKSTSLSYDPDGLLTSVHGFSINRHIEHGLPTKLTQGAYEQTRSYNGYGETTTLNQQVGSTALNTELTYNPLGQITQKTETIHGQTRTYQYQYDSRNRLTQVRLNGVEIERYGYDANGNRTLSTSTQRQVVNQIATYNNGDQLQASGNQSYAYDANGRLKSKTRITDDGLTIITTYHYSSEGRLLEVITPNAVVEYQHNALGNRVAKLVNGRVVEKYLWQNKTTLLATYDANDNLKQRFEYTLGHAPTAFTQNGERYYILSDQLGSPRIITDSSGNQIKEITYDSYGNVINDSAPEIEIPFGFAGGLQDKDTGLLRFGYRDYDPETGRWTARDPIGFEGGDSNLYGYVLGDPINTVDPAGLAPAWASYTGSMLSVVGGGLLLTGKPIGIPILMIGSALLIWDASTTPKEVLESLKPTFKEIDNAIQEIENSNKRLMGDDDAKNCKE